MQIPVIKINDNKFQIAIDTTLYSKEAITATLYKYTELYYVYEECDESKVNIVLITLESKDGQSATEETLKELCNALIDQQLRVDVSKQYGHIRDLIVEEAFKPVNK